MEIPPSVFLSLRYFESLLFIDSLLCLLKDNVNIMHMRCYGPVTSSNRADLLLRSHQTSQQTNFGRVRDQPGSPASIPALFQRFGCM